MIKMYEANDIANIEIDNYISWYINYCDGQNEKEEVHQKLARFHNGCKLIARRYFNLMANNNENHIYKDLVERCFTALPHTANYEDWNRLNPGFITNQKIN